MHTVILLYEKFTALDAVGPYEVLAQVPGARVDFVAREARPYRTNNGHLALVADRTLAEVQSADVLVVPGGPGSWQAAKDEALRAFIQRIHATTTWTTSVCTGAELLAAAGLLDGLPAATYWNCRKRLASLGAVPVEERWVRNGSIITAAGVSAGIDMAIQLVSWQLGEQQGQAMQLGIEYDPAPPFVFSEIPDAIRRQVAAEAESWAGQDR